MDKDKYVGICKVGEKGKNRNSKISKIIFVGAGEGKHKTAIKTIKDIVIGISLIGVELSDGTVGVAYVLRDGLPSGCSVFRYVK